MELTRAPKFIRDPQKVGKLELQERDVKILILVYSYRFLNSEQIKILVDGSDRVILTRLQKLFHHGYLDRPSSQMSYNFNTSQHIIYALGDKGADLLADLSGFDRGKIKWKEKNKEVKERHINHTLMISNFRICLEKSLSKPNSSVKMLFWRNESTKDLKDYVYIRDYRSGGHKTRKPIVPDSFFSIEDSKGKMYFFLEADQSTMTNTRFLNKMRAYWHWWKQKGHTKKFGIKSFRVLTLAKTNKRSDNLRLITQKADEAERGSLMFWFTSESNYSKESPESVLSSIWQTPKDDTFHHLLE
jgi:hypothetical protein